MIVTPGQQHESTVAIDLMDFITAGACIADGGYASETITNELKYRGIKPVIPPHHSAKKRRRYDKSLYSSRYLVECFFHNLKRFRRIATRYDKTIESFTGFVYLACAIQWLN